MPKRDFRCVECIMESLHKSGYFVEMLPLSSGVNKVINHPVRP
jgi:hypothetical protein